MSCVEFFLIGFLWMNRKPVSWTSCPGMAQNYPVGKMWRAGQHDV